MSTLARATVMLMGVSVLIRAFGFLRESVFAACYGASSSMDAFIVAGFIPSVCASIEQTAIVTAFVPLYNEYLAKENLIEGDQFLRSALGLIVVFSAVAMGLGIFLAPQIVSVLAPGFPRETQELTIQLIRIMMPTLFFSGLLGFASAVQNANHSFFLPMISQLVNNVILVTIILLFASSYGIFAAGFSSVFGIIVQVIMQWPGLKKNNYLFRVSFDFSHPGIKKMIKLLIPILAGIGAIQINQVIDRILASTLPTGSVSALNYAVRVNLVFVSLFVMPISTVLYPTIAKAYAANDIEMYKEHLNKAVRMIGFVIIPLMMMLIAFRIPLVEILFERGAFGPKATQQTAYALFFCATGLYGIAMMELLSKAFYAQKDTRTPLTVTVVVVSLNIVLNLLLIDPLAVGGLALSTSIANSVGMICLLCLINKKISVIDYKRLILSMSKIIVVSSLSMGLGIAIFSGVFEWLIQDADFPKIVSCILAGGVTVLSTVLFFTQIAHYFRCEEYLIIRSYLEKHLFRIN